jgi:hypothetical protein
MPPAAGQMENIFTPLALVSGSRRRIPVSSKAVVQYGHHSWMPE